MRATELEAANEARANELTERIAAEVTARGEALSELQTSISAMKDELTDKIDDETALSELQTAVDGVKTSITEVKDELTDKIDDETSSRNQALDAVRNAAVG